MQQFLHLRRVALALAALGILSLVGPGRAATAAAFEADGTFTFTSRDAGTLAGDANIGGPFIGTFSNAINGARVAGTATFTFGDGSTLTISYSAHLNHDTNVFEGSYSVTGGSGAFAGATGLGSITIDHGSTGNFVLDGDLS
jgi:hypothetical protein